MALTREKKIEVAFEAYAGLIGSDYFVDELDNLREFLTEKLFDAGIEPKTKKERDNIQQKVSKDRFLVYTKFEYNGRDETGSFIGVFDDFETAKKVYLKEIEDLAKDLDTEEGWKAYNTAGEIMLNINLDTLREYGATQTILDGMVFVLAVFEEGKVEVDFDM